MERDQAVKFMLDTLRKVSGSLPPIVCLQAEPDEEAETPRTFLPPQAQEFSVLPMAEDALASIVYTSGTTGRPKGVKLSHRNIISNAEAALKVVDLHAGSSRGTGSHRAGRRIRSRWSGS